MLFKGSLYLIFILLISSGFSLRIENDERLFKKVLNENFKEEINDELYGTILDIEGILKGLEGKNKTQCNKNNGTCGKQNEKKNKKQEIIKDKEIKVKSKKTGDKKSEVKTLKNKSSGKEKIPKKDKQKKIKENSSKKQNQKSTEKRKLIDSFITMTTDLSTSTELKQLQNDYLLANSIGEKSPKLTYQDGIITDCTNLHSIFQIPESKDMKLISLFVVIIFGTIYLILRLLFSTSKKLTDDFLLRNIQALSDHSIYYFILVAILFVIYTIGLLDKIIVNWQFIISGLFLFGIYWWVFCSILILFCYFIVRRWKEVEVISKNLKNLKNDYENRANEEVKGKNRDSASILDYYEYHILKTYFIIPFYPTFKPSNLRKDFNFGMYLTFCLNDKLKLFFKFSWTCWLAGIVTILFWNVLISKNSLTMIKVMMFLAPLGNVIMAIVNNIVMKSIYRKVVAEVNKVNYMDFVDIAPFDLGKTRTNFLNYPIYLENILEKMKDENTENIVIPQSNFSKFFHNKPPTIYEDIMVFGVTGFHLMMNSIQILGFLFVLWSTLLAVFYLNQLRIDSGNGMVAAYIIVTVLYTIIYGFFIALNLRWFTIISSIEMMRSEKNIKKVISKQSEQAAELVEQIYSGFKRLYYDIRLIMKKKQEIDEIIPFDENLGLSKNTLTNLINILIRRFQSVPKSEINNLRSYAISIDEELKLFFKVSGNKMNQDEIQHLEHFIEKISDVQIENLTNNELYEMFFANLFFSSQFPHQIVFFIFEKYYEERDDIEAVTDLNQKDLNTSKITDFMQWYSNYFTNEQIQFIKEECAFLENDFSINGFTQMLLSLRRYHPY